MSQVLNTSHLNANVSLDMEQIKAVCPSVFTDHAAPSTTQRYTHLPTSVVVQDMMDLGWQVVKAQEIKARKNKGYQKHLVVFRHPDIMIKGQNGDDAYPQLLLTNSHDGKSAFHFRVGIYRLVCSNGLVVADAEFSNMVIRHFGYTFEQLQTSITGVINGLPNLVNKINLFKSTILSQTQLNEFARKAIDFRGKSDINIENLLTPVRDQDTGSDLWSTFNRVQEKLIGGNFKYGRKNRQARSIKNFQQDIKINEQLFELAASYCAA